MSVPGHGPQTWQFKSCVAIPLRIASNINMNYDCVASCVWVLKVHAYTVKATANDRQCMYTGTGHWPQTRELFSGGQDPAVIVLYCMLTCSAESEQN